MLDDETLATETIPDLSDEDAYIPEEYSTLEDDDTLESLPDEYRQSLEEQEAPAPDTTAPPDVDSDLLRIYPMANVRYQELLEAGVPDEMAQQKAWRHAHEEDTRIQAAVQHRLEQELAPYQEILAPTVIGQEVGVILGQIPVVGVTSQELTQLIVEAGIPLHEWTTAPAAQKQSFVQAAAQQVGYQKFLRGEIAPPTSVPRAPAQTPPGVFGNTTIPRAGGTEFEEQVDHVMHLMGLSREDAEDVVRG